MDTKQIKERILLNERQEGRQLAVAEALALKYRYEGSFYTFQYGGQCVNARFLTACLQTEIQPVNGYRIELMAPHETFVDGPCMITDMHGRKVSAVASTTHGNAGNLITIETTAFHANGQSI